MMLEVVPKRVYQSNNLKATVLTALTYIYIF